MTTTPTRGPELERILAENQHQVGQVDRSTLPSPPPAPPGRRLAVIACMDARLTVEDVLGLRTGDAHIIRNAGGLATEDAIRSLVISQHLLGTEEVIVVEHTGCGMLTFEDEAVRQQIASVTGMTLDIPLHSFPDLESNLRAQVELIRSHPWVKDVPVSGVVYEVESGRLRHVV
jgi:carbonic anhydrase